MRLSRIFLSLMMIACFVSLACSVTVGPVAERVTVIYRPGKPGKILQNIKVEIEQLETKEHTIVDVGGWVAMPLEHWQVIEKKLAGLAEEKKP